MFKEFEIFIIVLGALVEVLLIIIIIIAARVTALKRRITDLQIQLRINLHEQTVRHHILLDQIKRQQNKPHTLDELQRVFDSKIESLRHQYPALTDLDIQVLTLIGIGVDNAEILQFTDMSKRTYYKRRQLIANRMNTTAAQLDQLAKTIFTPNL